MLLHFILSLTIAQAPLDAERAPTPEDQDRAHNGCEESVYKLQSRRVRVGSALAISGLVLEIAAVVIPLATRTKIGTMTPVGPMCVSGKPECWRCEGDGIATRRALPLEEIEAV